MNIRYRDWILTKKEKKNVQKIFGGQLNPIGSFGWNGYYKSIISFCRCDNGTGYEEDVFAPVKYPHFGNICI